MHSVNNLNNVLIDHVPVECYYPAFFQKNITSNEFYRQFTFKGINYTVGNYILIDGEHKTEVAKISCIFIDKTRMVQLVVRKYLFAADLKELLLKEDCSCFYDSEIVEDITKDYVVQADKVLKKCFVIFAEENDSDVIQENKLDSSIYFLCRYSLKTSGLFPIFSTSSTILSENNSKSPPRKPCSIKKQQKQKLDSENINVRLSDEMEKASPKNGYKNIKTPTTDVTFSPVQRNSVKRNLNKSFGTCSGETNDSILNYSIVSDDDTDNPFLLKLRISESNAKPFVLLKKLNDSDSPKEKGEQGPENPIIRKSTRPIQRKSYADYISPIKGRKRINSYEDSGNNRKTEPPQKFKEKLGTPKKTKSNEEISSEKREIKTPKKSREGHWSPQANTSPQGSARRSLRLTTSRGASRDRNKRETSVPDSDTEKTPKKRINLDESIRRSILKIRLNKADLEEHTSPDNVKKRHKNKYTDGLSDTSESENNDKNTNRNRTISASPSTPKHRQKPNSVGELDVDRSVFKTPKTNRNMTPKQTPKTPKNRAKLIREGVITPSMHSRGNVVAGDKTPLMKARSQLHVSYVPNALPCRDKEYNTVLNFVEDKLSDGCGGCIYISGVPGTGKTATVTSVISDLQLNKDIPKFVFVSINGMRLTEPKQAYVEILKQLSGKTVHWEQAQSILEEKFTKSQKMVPTVMLVDELDVLYTRRQDVVYNLLDWPSKAQNQLIVITIANTMDLPERLLVNRVASRLGLTRLTFQAYTHGQLQEIVIKRLSGTECFNPDAIQLVARKVASVSGDARRALDICRRAAEIAESESSNQLVSMDHVNKAVASMITQPKVRAIKCCSRLEQLILQSIVAEVERTGVEETTFSDVFKMLVSCAAIEGFKMVSSTIALSAVSRLSACRLILTDPKCNDITQKLILNVSVDDVYYALKKDLA